MWPYAKHDPIADFWRAFAEREEALARAFGAGAMGDAEPLMRALHERLTRVDPVLGFEFGRGEGGRLDLCITPDGRVSAFQTARALVEAAPASTRWNFHCFRKRSDLDDVTLRAGDTEINARDVRYVARFDAKIEIALFFDLPGSPDEDALYGLGVILLDHALGEFDAATSIESLEVFNARDPADAEPLLDLPKAFDAWRARVAN